MPGDRHSMRFRKNADRISYIESEIVLRILNHIISLGFIVHLTGFQTLLRVAREISFTLKVSSFTAFLDAGQIPAILAVNLKEKNTLDFRQVAMIFNPFVDLKIETITTTRALLN